MEEDDTKGKAAGPAVCLPKGVLQRLPYYIDAEVLKKLRIFPGISGKFY